MHDRASEGRLGVRKGPAGGSAQAAATGKAIRTSAGDEPLRLDRVLVVLCTAQLLIIADAAIMNVALVAIRNEFAIEGQMTLVLTVSSYGIAFGGFLPLAGKLTDRWGQWVVFSIGSALLGIGGIIGAVAPNEGGLIAGRLVQGLGCAFAGSSALSLLAIIFHGWESRTRALAFWWAIPAVGGMATNVLGGAVVEYASWRWAFVILSLVAFALLVAGLRYLPRLDRNDTVKIDPAGAILLTAALSALMLGLSLTESDGWTSPGPLAAGSLAIICMLVWIAILRQGGHTPLVPGAMLRERNLVGGSIGGFLIFAAKFGIFFFVILWLQLVKGWGPFATGLAILPYPLATIVGAWVGPSIIRRFGITFVVGAAPLAAALAYLVLSCFLSPSTSYFLLVLPCIAIVAVSISVASIAFSGAALSNVTTSNSGVASGFLTASQQVGGAVGLAALTAIASQVTSQIRASAIPTDELHEMVVGWQAGLAAGAVAFLLAAVAMGVLIRLQR